MLPDPLFLNVHMYGIMISVGILAAFAALHFYGKKVGLTQKLIDFIFYTGVAVIVFGFFTSALFQSLYDYIEDPSKGFKITGDITFIGGLIGGAVLFLIIYACYRKKLDMKLSSALPTIACCITVGHGFGRVGCFFAGCCYGKETDFFLAVKFPKLPNPVHPTQLYEAAFLFLLFGVLSYLTLKKKYRGGFAVYLCSYAVFRFLVEFIRDDHRGELVAGISPSQFWSIGMFLIGVIMFIVYATRKPAPETIPEKVGEIVEEIAEEISEDIPDETPEENSEEL